MGVSFAAEHKALIKKLNYSEYSVDEVVPTGAQLEMFIARVFKIWDECFIKWVKAYVIGFRLWIGAELYKGTVNLNFHLLAFEQMAFTWNFICFGISRKWL